MQNPTSGVNRVMTSEVGIVELGLWRPRHPQVRIGKATKLLFDSGFSAGAVQY